MLDGDDLSQTLTEAVLDARTGKAHLPDGEEAVFDLGEPARLYKVIPSISFEFLRVGYESYSRSGVGTPWEGGDTSSATAIGVDLLRKMPGEEVTFVGLVEVHGEQVKLYEWTQEVAKFNDSVEPADSDDTEVDLSVWVNDDGLPVQARHNLPPIHLNGSVQELSVTETFDGWGETVLFPVIHCPITSGPELRKFCVS